MYDGRDPRRRLAGGTVAGGRRQRSRRAAEAELAGGLDELEPTSHNHLASVASDAKSMVSRRAVERRADYNYYFHWLCLRICERPCRPAIWHIRPFKSTAAGHADSLGFNHRSVSVAMACRSRLGGA